MDAAGSRLLSNCEYDDDDEELTLAPATPAAPASPGRP